MTDNQAAIVLKTESVGESFLKLHLLTVEQGIFLCLKRISKKSGHDSRPDLFDHALLTLENSKQGTMRFVKEYQLLQRRESIGLNYRSLQAASNFAQLLARNGSHMPESERLFELTTRTLNALAEGKAPEIVLLKGIYLLLKDEGYAVRESWWYDLPHELKKTAKELIETPSPSKCTPETRNKCGEIQQHLNRWMGTNTDLIIPE